jgi:dynein heavy chain
MTLEAAVSSLDKGSLMELKASEKPTDDVQTVMSAVLILMADKPQVPDDLSWTAVKRMMADLPAFAESLARFDKDSVDSVLVVAVEEGFMSGIKKMQFDLEEMQLEHAVGNLRIWVINICRYWRMYQELGPHRTRLNEAWKEMEAVNEQMTFHCAKLAEIDEWFAHTGEVLEQLAISRARTETQRDTQPEPECGAQTE